MKEGGRGGRRELSGVREVLEAEIEGEEMLMGGSEGLERRRDLRGNGRMLGGVGGLRGDLGDVGSMRGELGDVGSMRGELGDVGSMRGVLGKGCIVGREGQVLLITRSTR